MLYQITDGTLTYGEREVLSHIDFTIKGTEKLALVGANGAGKTTLLRVIAGELALDRDDKRKDPEITLAREITIGMLRQSTQPEDAGEELSGGQQTRRRLAELLDRQPDLLLLDEPTNHLDSDAVEWLEKQLRNYPGAVLFASHDRYFLDQTACGVYELSNGRLTRYAGNYSDYRRQKQQRLSLERKAYERQQAEIARLNELIERFKNKPKKAAFARSRRSMLDRMVKLDPPETDDVHIFTQELLPATPGSKWPIVTDHLKIGYDHVLAELTLRVRRGQKIGIIGANGAGKSTFLKTLAGYLPALEGKYMLGIGDVFGYFDQNTAAISSDQTVAEHFRERFPAMPEKELRATLGAYLFRGEEAAKHINDLSGGEKSRLILAELLTAAPHLLLLDEPTNHMDIAAKETLESAFTAYQGTILFVSHDRYFVSHVADAVLAFEKDGIGYDPFGYEHYRNKRLSGDYTAARLSAENQALIAGFEAVPEKERHETRPLTTEEAYVDWQLSLAEDAMQEAAQRAGALWMQMEEQKARLMEADFIGHPEETAQLEREYGDIARQVEEAWDIWTRACLEWDESFI